MSADITAADDLLKQAGLMTYLLTDKGYDANLLCHSRRQTGTVPVISGRSSRKRKIRYDKTRDKDQHRRENAFCRIKDARHLATRSDQRARTFLSASALAVLLAYCL